MSMAFSKERFETPCGEGEQSCVLCRRFPSFCPIESNENAFDMAERAELLKRLEDETISEDKKMLIKKALGMEHFADDSKKVKSYCETCFWWNQTCHNAKSCCYGDEREANNFCGWWEYKNPETNTEPYDFVNHPNHYTQGRN